MRRDPKWRKDDGNVLAHLLAQPLVRASHRKCNAGLSHAVAIRGHNEAVPSIPLAATALPDSWLR